MTRRLIVRDWRRTLQNPIGRKWIEDSLRSALSASVVAHLPEPLRLADGDHAVNEWVSKRAAESDVFLVLGASSGNLIGLLLLAQSPEPSDTTELHVGYILAEGAWGKGIATELLIGLISALSESAPLLLFGGVGKENPASSRVLEKAGFIRSPERSSPDTDMFVRPIA